jgi:hypothetical protein
MKKALFLVVILVLFAGHQANAAIVQTFNFQSSSSTGLEETISVEKFHGNLEDLISIHVKFDLYAQNGTTFTGEYTGAGSYSGSFEVGQSVTISSDASLITSIDPLDFVGGSGELDMVRATPFSFSGPDSISANGYDLTASDSGFIALDLVGGQWVGADTFDITVDMDLLLGFRPGTQDSTFYFGVDETVINGGTLTVTYEAIPVPAGVWLLGSGLLGLLGLRKKLG